MLIGISGYIGSGKDTVAQLIQGLIIANHKYEASGRLMYNDSYIKQLAPEGLTALSGWKVKKFAGKLKEMVSLITGISVQDLEKSEIKDSVLGEEWWLWHETSSWSNQVKTYAYSQYKEAPSFPHCTLIKPTVRWLLQTLGTDAMRDRVHPNIHVNALFADYKKGPWKGLPSEYNFDAPNALHYPHWILSDMRFPNELKAIKDRSGFTVRINRIRSTKVLVDTDSMTAFGKQQYEDWIAPHPSETALDDAQFDYVIENNSGIPELLEQVKQMLINFNILQNE